MTTIYCPATLRSLWPSPLAQQWHDQYPGLFDQDDLRLANSQGQPSKYHFYEWFAAIYLFQRDGSLSMVEKYIYPSHRLKVARCRNVLSEDQWSALVAIEKSGVQLPDLMVLAPDGNSFSFAEVKGDHDQLSLEQTESHAVIGDRLDVTVEILKVMLFDMRPAEAMI